MPQNPSLCYPSIPHLLTAASFAPLPWRTVQWQGAFRSVYARVPACIIGGTVGGGGLPSPKLPRCPGHSGAENIPASPSSSSLVLVITLPGSSAVLPWPGRPCYTSAALPPWPTFSRSVSLLPLANAVSSCSPPKIHPPYPPHTPCTLPVPSVPPGKRVPLPSSVTCTPPPTESLPPGMGGRLFRLSS